MRTTLAAAVTCGALLLGAPASSASTAPGPLRIVGTPALVYSQHGRAKSVTYAFETNRRLRSKWALYISGMYPVFVSEGRRGTCYSGEFGIEADEDVNIYRALRPGKLLTLDVREGKPYPRRARRGVRVQRARTMHEEGTLAVRACRR